MAIPTFLVDMIPAYLMLLAVAIFSIIGWNQERSLSRQSQYLTDEEDSVESPKFYVIQGDRSNDFRKFIDPGKAS